uniref:Uncharacterized protein n=1 Tax=Caenorhabditis japonica TaxID=281687 RepID=A0A8R1EG51_CAEJA
MDRSTMSTIDGKERLTPVIKETSSDPLPTLRQVSTKLMRNLDLMSSLSSSLSSVTDVAHIHSNDTMFPLTPATPQGIKVLDSPAGSPDHNPIENLWELFVPRNY